MHVLANGCCPNVIDFDDFLTGRHGSNVDILPSPQVTDADRAAS